MLRPFFPELVMSTDLLSLEHPSVLLFCLRLVNDLLDAMEKQEVTAPIAIDLSAVFNAFNAVDHQILIDVLQNQYAPVGTPGFKPRIRPPYPQRVVKGD